MALPAGNVAKASGAAGATKQFVERRAPADDAVARRKNPFDVHPKNFKNYRLIWEVYKSQRE